MSFLQHREQLKIDWDYDDRAERLSMEFAIMITPHLAPGTPREKARDLAVRLALLACKRVSSHVEPPEPMRCHSCDALVGPDERARVVACVRCAMRGSPGSDG